MFPTSPKKIQSYLRHLGASPQKKWGQNFLLETKYHLEIKKAADLSKQDIVLEIGAGLGHLTQFIQPLVHKLYIVEIDPIMVKALETSFDFADNVEILSADILQKKKLLNSEITEKIQQNLGNCNFKIVANLPYNISAPVIVNFLNSSLPVQKMVLMVQKEIAQRLSSRAREEFYGPLSLQAQIYADIKMLKDVPAKAFFPEPKVTSSIISVTPHNRFLETIDNLSLFKALVQSTFCLRRKKISNSLQKGAGLPKVSKDTIEFLNQHFDLSRRPETFSVEEFIKMANLLHENLCNEEEKEGKEIH